MKDSKANIRNSSEAAGRIVWRRPTDLHAHLFGNVVILLLLVPWQTGLPVQDNPPAVHAGYCTVNGLRMYYEFHGVDSDKPVLVLIHGGGSTITTTFRTILPFLSRNRKILAVELQAHGHTFDIDRPETFEQDADDIAAVVSQLHITQADFFGFSNGATTALQMGIRHPAMVHNIIAVAGAFKRGGFPAGFWEGMNHATLENMPVKLKEAYLRVAPNPKGLMQMFNKDLNRMLEFKDIPAEEIRSIQAPTFIINGDADVVLPEHAVELFRLLPHARLAILPGGHGECIGEIEYAGKQSTLPALTASMIDKFLDTPFPD